MDSTVAAKLMHEAIGDRQVSLFGACSGDYSDAPAQPHRFRFHAIMVDNGVLRLNEAQQVYDMLNKDLGVNLTVVDASTLFLSRLEGVEDPEQKRRIIGNTFINVFEEEATKIEAAADAEEKLGAAAKGRVEWLLQGTLYPDVIESISFKGPSATIKTHHNVGGLLKDMKLKLIEPLRELFKGKGLSHFHVQRRYRFLCGQMKCGRLGDFFLSLHIWYRGIRSQGLDWRSAFWVPSRGSR